MYRRSDWLEIGFFGLGFVFLYAGAHFHISALTNLGGICIGAFPLVAGIQAIRTKRLGFETHQRDFGPISTYKGLAAQLWGFLFITFAVLIFILVGIAWFYPEGNEAFWSAFLDKSWGWGFILICAGLTVMVMGIITLISGSAGYYKGLADQIQRFSGLIPFIIGLGVAAVGVMLVFFPESLSSLLLGVMNTIGHWILH